MNPFIELNRRNQEYWGKQRVLFEKRMADPALLETAFCAMRWEHLRGLPLYYQTPLEKALEDADHAKARCLLHLCTEFARKGGLAQKADALQELIYEIVTQNPLISDRELLNRLESFPKGGVIDDIDIDGNEIEFRSNGKDKKASISGLKDRLSRAKKKFRSR